MEQVLISADSHVYEPADLWQSRLPAALSGKPLPIAGVRPSDFEAHPGGHDPHARLEAMKTDGVSREVLYPTLGLLLFGLDDVELQEACFTVYNDWLSDYCKVAPQTLMGVGLLSCYRIESAVAELRRCRQAGMLGAEIWQAPAADLPLHSTHYEPLWAAAQELGMPISLHILTGHDASKETFKAGAKRDPFVMGRSAVNLKLSSAMNGLYDLIWSGVFERFPRLRVVLVENEIGWLPWVLQQWDYYYHRFIRSGWVPTTLHRPPSEFFAENVFATFFNDAVGTRQLGFWGTDNCMWSNDFPHPNSTWPNSRQVIERHLGHLSETDREKVLHGNAIRLYRLSA